MHRPPTYISQRARPLDDGQSIPYHNKAHAASVMHMTHATMHLGGAAKMVGAGHWFRPWLQHQEGHQSQYASGEDATSMEKGAFETLACLLAAAVHDFEHLGISNDFLVKTDDERAIKYNDRSVNENHHVAAAFGKASYPSFVMFPRQSTRPYDVLNRPQP